MTVTIKKKGSKAKPIILASPPKDYGVKVGHCFLRADGALDGCVVLDTSEVLKTGNVRVQSFSPQGWGACIDMDAFSLSQVRYYEAEAPAWQPKRK